MKFCLLQAAGRFHGVQNAPPDMNISDYDIQITSYFNAQAYHSIAVALSVMGNALLKYCTGDNNYNIRAVNHPLPQSKGAEVRSFI